MFGMSDATIYNWLKQERIDCGEVAGLSTEDVTAIQQASQRLQQSASKIGEALNRAASQGGASGGGQAGSSGSGEDVVDAEFEEVDPGDRKAS